MRLDTEIVIKTLPLAVILLFLIPVSKSDVVYAQGKDCCQVTYRNEDQYELKTTFRFYWMRLYSEDQHLLEKAPDLIVHNPGTWNDLILNDEKLGSYGYASYALEIYSDHDYPDLAVTLAEFYSAYRLYLNGELIAQNGELGKSPGTSSYESIPLTVPARLKEGANDLVIEVSNYQHDKGGFFSNITIGRYEVLSKLQRDHIMIDMFTVGAFLMIAAFFLGLFFYWKRSYEILFYIIFAASYGFRILTNGQYLFNVIFPNLHWEWSLRIEYIVMYTTWISSGLIFYKVYPRKLIQVIVGFFILFIVSVFTPTHFYTSLINYTIFIGILVFCIQMFLVVKSYYLVPRKLIITVPFLVLMLAAWGVEYLIYYDYVPYLMYFPNLMRLLSVLILAFLVSENYTAAYEEIEGLQLQAESQKKIIEAQYEEIESFNRSQKIWLRNIAHELRTPITLIHGPLELLDNGSSQINQSRLITVARKNAYRLFYLVDQLLSMVRHQDNALAVNKEWVNICEICQKTLTYFMVEAEMKSVSIVAEKPSKDLEIFLDRPGIEQVLFNLVSNSLKFTPDGGEVTMSMHRQSDDAWQIIISDTGSGINREDVEHIFDLYFTRSNDSSKAGVGIGLYMCKVLIEEMGGSIQVESELENGTTVMLNFPGSMVRNVSEPPPASRQNHGKLLMVSDDKMKILVAEDEPETRYYLDELLKPFAEMVLVKNGQEALDRAGLENFDLLITDVNMPGLSGIDLLKRLEAKSVHFRYGTIMLTAYSLEEEILAAFVPGVNEYIRKPFEHEVLLSTIAFLKNNSKGRKVETSKDKTSEDTKRQAEEIFSCIRENLADSSFKVLGIADELCMSERQLFRICKEVTGMTPANLVKNMRLDEARRIILEKPHMRISDVAHQVGYSSHSYFTSSFQKRFGFMPSNSSAGA